MAGRTGALHHELRRGAATPTEAELQELLPKLPGWSVADQHHLQRALSFPDFQNALEWVIAAGAICEDQGHHAEFSLGWGHAEAVIDTHKVDGLTQADAVLEAKFNTIGTTAG